MTTDLTKDTKATPKKAKAVKATKVVAPKATAKKAKPEAKLTDEQLLRRSRGMARKRKLHVRIDREKPGHVRLVTHAEKQVAEGTVSQMMGFMTKHPPKA